MRHVLSKLLVTLAMGVALAVLLALSGCAPAEAPRQAVVPEVGVISVTAQTRTVTSELPGRTRAWMEAQIRPQVGGIVQQRLFTEGAQVAAGEVLYQLDPAVYQSAYDEALASAAKTKAALASAQLKAKRYAALGQIDAISQQDNEDAQTGMQTAAAELKVAEAGVASARINLAYTRITAPIDGRIDSSSVTPGALVTASQETALATVQQIDPLYIDISQPSTELLRLKRELAAGTLQTVAKGEAVITLLLEDGSTYPHSGRLQFSGASVNEGTGSVTLRAVVPNPDGLLLPGMYVRAVLQEATDATAIAVPQRAVTRSHNGATSVLLVVDGRVEQRLLSLGSSVGNNWWVRSGLNAGEQVIIEGGQKVRIGDSVTSVAVARSVVSEATLVSSAAR
jgi:membrane fusion protein (multidrug efflux system)